MPKTRWDAGQFKLRGKKHMHLTCGCCTITDLRHEYNKKEIQKDMNNPISDLDQDAIDMYGKPLTGKYKHYCLEFDYLPIDENNTEFAYCQCYESSKEIEELKRNVQWEQTNRELEWINKEFVQLHETNQRDWNQDQVNRARYLRARCIELQEERYSLLVVDKG